MALETATFISQLNDANPAAGDLKSQGDDHIRMLKDTLLNTFPNFSAGAVSATTIELSLLKGKSSVASLEDLACAQLSTAFGHATAPAFMASDTDGVIFLYNPSAHVNLVPQVNESGEIVLDVLNPAHIRSAGSAVSPTSGQILRGDGWGSEEYVLLNQTSLSSGSFMHLQLPTGYPYGLKVVLWGLVADATSNNGIELRKNDSGDGIYDSTEEIIAYGPATGSVNCASVTNTESITSRNNQTALRVDGMQYRTAGTNETIYDKTTIEINEQTSDLQVLKINTVEVHPNGSTTAQSGTFYRVESDSIGLMKTKSHMTSLVISTTSPSTHTLLSCNAAIYGKTRP